MFKSDKFRKSRGGWSRYLEIKCESCDNILFYYQKDGPGPLKRSYHDRIIGKMPDYDSKGYWFCPSCGACLGFYEPYKKENDRPALRWANIAAKYKIVTKNLVQDS